MKKITSVFLSALMILASFCAVIPAGAVPSGTPINTAEDFKNMSADGTYYLNADITLAETYATTFTGTFDGNGHTVTVSVPMFKQMNGTVKNLITVGEITVALSNKAHIGALAQQSKGATVDNVTNKANITVTQTGGSEGRVGGIIGRLNGHGNTGHAAVITNCINEGNVTGCGSVGGIVGGSYDNAIFENCTNKGNINNTAGVKDCFAGGGIYGYSGSTAVTVKNCINTGGVVSALHAGGIAGAAKKSAVFENCTNKGNVSLSSTAKSDYDSAAGGIVGFALDNGCTVALTFDNCVNDGDVNGYITGSADGRAAGIAGYTAKCGTVSVVVKNCINNGTIKAGNQGGGIIGYVYGSGSTFATIDSCINNGDVYAGQFASEFLAYSNANGTVLANSIGAGKLYALDEGKTVRLAMVGMSSGDIAEYTMENLFIADGDTTTLLSWANSDDNAKNRVELNENTALGKDYSSTVKAITRGELNSEFIAAANTAVGSELFAIKNGKVAFKTLSVGSDHLEPATGVTLGAVSVKIKETKQIPIISLTPVGTTDVIEWSSNDVQIATVVDGFVTGVSEGNVKITATLNDSVSAECWVTVIRVPATALELNANTLTIKAGATATLEATVLPADTTDDIVWSSDKGSVVTVADGVVTAVAEGTTVIKAICGDFTAECVVTVESASCQHKNTITEGYHAPNHVKQWAGESGVTTCLDCGEKISENVKLAPTAHKAGKTYTYDDKEHWKVCTYSGCTAEVKNTRGAHTYNDAGVCTVCGCGADGTLRGDLNADGKVTSDDAVYLLKYSLFGASQYPVSQNVDLNKDGKVTSDDAVYLLKYTLFGSGYPLD